MTTSNVDPAEIAKFERLAARWWDPNSEFQPLHAINPLRLDWIEQRAGGLAGKRVLDVGCGGGILTESLAARAAGTVGIDMGEAPLAVARLHLRGSDLAIDYRQTTAEALAAAEPASFDLVCCMEMLEHVPEPDSVVDACARLVRPGGHVVFSTINRNPKAWLFAVVGAEYVLRLLPRGTHEYAKFIRPAELERWARQSGLEVGAATGMHYDPLARTYSLGPGLDVNYLMHFRRAGAA